MHAVVYAWICRELIARIKSPKYLDRWFRENPGGLSNRSLLHCTAGLPSTGTGTLLDLGTAQISRVCPQHKDVRREGTNACVSLALLWGCISGLGITIPAGSASLDRFWDLYSRTRYSLVQTVYTVPHPSRMCWVISVTLYILISNPVPLLSLIWLHWARGQYWFCFWFWRSEAALGGRVGSSSGNSLPATYSPNKS